MLALTSAHARRVFLAAGLGTFAPFPGCDGSGGTGKPAVAHEAARSHARAAFLHQHRPTNTDRAPATGTLRIN